MGGCRAGARVDCGVEPGMEPECKTTSFERRHSRLTPGQTDVQLFIVNLLAEQEKKVSNLRMLSLWFHSANCLLLSLGS